MKSVSARRCSRALRAALVGGLAWSLLAACDAGTVCSTAGAVNGFSVIAKLPVGVAAKVTTIQTCVNEVCQTSPGQLNPADPLISIQNDQVSSGNRVAVSVYLLDGDGGRVGGGSAEVTPIQIQPNGPNCGPTAWLAKVTASPDALSADTS